MLKQTLRLARTSFKLQNVRPLQQPLLFSLPAMNFSNYRDDRSHRGSSNYDYDFEDIEEEAEKAVKFNQNTNSITVLTAEDIVSKELEANIPDLSERQQRRLKSLGIEELFQV
jgi:hypothetical protein